MDLSQTMLTSRLKVLLIVRGDVQLRTQKEGVMTKTQITDKKIVSKK